MTITQKKRKLVPARTYGPTTQTHQVERKFHCLNEQIQLNQKLPRSPQLYGRICPGLPDLRRLQWAPVTTVRPPRRGRPCPVLGMAVARREEWAARERISVQEHTESYSLGEEFLRLAYRLFLDEETAGCFWIRSTECEAFVYLEARLRQLHP